MRDEILDIVKIQLEQLKKMLQKNNIHLDFTDEVVEKLAQEGYDPQFGARPLKRVIQKELINELSKKILSGEVSNDSEIQVNIILLQHFFKLFKLNFYYI